MESIEKDIERFLAVHHGSGDGSGYGSGDGSGYGDGSGSGYGDGSGSGYGDGDGDGDGYGSGYGDGDGDGDGYGSGYGDGDGDGDGYGDGWRSINGDRIYMFDDTPTVIYSVKGQVARGAFVRADLTLDPCYIARVGNSFAHGETIRKAVEDATEKDMQDRPLEERIAMFVQVHPDLDTPYGDLFQWHSNLTGSCRMGRENWCREHGLNPTDSITVRQFIEGTKDNFGGGAIRQLAKSYNIELN